MSGRTYWVTRMLATPLLVGGVLFSAPLMAATPVNDVRILIDISGSMKQNDPQNLRAPALRLLTGLLPKGSQAGVWTYGQYVNMLVPHGEVNSNWKSQADHASSAINSHGLFTNIEGALEQATRDWREADDNSQRSLIMLTDGFVDISKDPAQNAAARDRIINSLLPRLRDAKAKIYSVALSAGADHTLLRQLAAATDGWYEQADNADRLQRIFLHLFEKAAQPDTLPLAGNVVKVDNSIEEITFLIFRDADGKPTQLVQPNRIQFGMNNAPKSARWHSDTGYDLITITKPQPGDWRVLGPVDVDNRVVIVTNLKVRATPLPNNLSLEDTPYYFVQLMQQDSVIHRKDFVDLVNITLQQSQEGGQRWEWRLHDDGKDADIAAGDGTFSHKFMDSIKEGRHEITLLVDGTTFQREQRQVINIYSQPAEASVVPDRSSAGRFVLSVIPRAGLIEPDTMEVTATVTDSNDATEEIPLTRAGPAEWRAELLDHTDSMGYKAEFQVSGKHAGGKPVSAMLGPYQFTAAGVAIIDKLPEQAGDPATKQEGETVTEASSDHDQAVDQESPDDAGHEINWTMVVVQTLLINALLIGGGFFAYRKWRKSGKKDVAGLAGDDAGEVAVEEGAAKK